MGIRAERAIRTLILAIALAWSLPALAKDPSAPPQPAASSPPSSAPPPRFEDPELAAPLEPLDAFAARAASQAAASPAPPLKARSARLAYRLKITGLPTRPLWRRFTRISLLARGRGRATDADQLAARAAEDERLLVSFLHSEGYFDAAARLSSTPGTARDPRETVTLAAEPGPRYALAKVEVTGPPTVPPGLAERALNLHPGEAIVAPVILAAEAQVTARLPQQGYPFARIGAHGIVLDNDARKGDYTLPVEAGARARFGVLTQAGKAVLPLWQLRVLPRFREGQIYDSRQVDDLRRELIATGLYATAAVTPMAPGAVAGDGTAPVDVQVEGTPAKPHSLSGAVGYQTGLGGTAEIDWTDHDLLPPEGALTVRGMAGTQQSLAGLTFVRSDLGQRDQNLQLIAQVSRETLDAYNADAVELAASLARVSTPLWQKLWTWSVGVQGILSQETGYDPAAGATVRRTYEIAALPLQVQYDRSNDLLDPTRGFRLSVQPMPEVSVGDGRPFMETLINATAYEPVMDHLVLAGRIQLGQIGGAAVQDIPPSQRFYAGGGGSVRGYAYQGVGPKDAQGAPIGGVASTLVSGEARFRFGDYGVVAFVDGGQVYESGTPRFSGMQYGAGLGFRYFTSFGPVRFDVAVPLTRRPGDPPAGVYISIGQAF